MAPPDQIAVSSFFQGLANVISALTSAIVQHLH